MMSANAFAAPSTPTKTSLDDDKAPRATDKCPPPPARPSTTSTDNFLHSMMMLNTDDHQDLAIPALHLNNFQEFHHILRPPPTIMRIKLKPRFNLKPKHTQHCSSSSRPMKVCRTVKHKHATNTTTDVFKKKTMVQKSMSTYQVVGSRSNHNMMQVGRCRSASFGSPAA